ncbi:MAG: filamentous hemagglutinin N-terminal domain-containing protein, partial [Selenomonadaceae bacterium]|nr:filamentous hemagglutinin N-terminal domain-containing protein [Selenomonadaceae bacterium]
MKFRSLKKKAATAALAALVTMALSSGSVFAAANMPTGGSVISGSVTGITDGTVANNGTLSTNGNSIINWQDFSIGAGNVLNVNTANGALLNRVVGNSLSEIMGTLNQTGCYPMFLVNPNGILVGATARINASELVLSTLDIDNDDAFTSGQYDKGVMYGHFAENSNRGKIVFKDGAVVNFQKPIDASGNKT